MTTKKLVTRLAKIQKDSDGLKHYIIWDLLDQVADDHDLQDRIATHLQHGQVELGTDEDDLIEFVGGHFDEIEAVFEIARPGGKLSGVTQFDHAVELYETVHNHILKGIIEELGLDQA